MERKTGIPNQVLSMIIKAYEERMQMPLQRDKLSYMDFHEARPLKESKPELWEKVLELRAEDKIDQKELRKFSKIIKEHPDLAEYAIKLKEKGKEVYEIRKAVEFVATQPEDIKREFVEEDRNKFLGI